MRLVALALLVLSLSACGAVATETPDDSTGTAPSTPAASVAPSTEPSAPAASAPAASAPSGSTAAGPLETQAISFLSSQLNVAEDELTLQRKEQVDWNDGALGCPQPGMMYTQAIVPGYKLTYTTDGQTYELHTDESGRQIVWCEGGQPKQIGQP